MAFVEEPTAYLVAGRTLLVRFEEDEVDGLFSRIDGLAGELDEPLVVIPEGDFTDTGVPISERAELYCVVGLLVSYTTTYPDMLDCDSLTAALASARDLPWDVITDLVPDLVEEPDIRARAWFGKEIGLYATACGPLAGVMVGYGVLSKLRDDYDRFDGEDEARFFADENGAAAVTPGLELVRGNLETQVPQRDAVYGVWVARGLYDGGIPALIDISQNTHRERVERLGPLAGQSDYYLIGHYD